MPLWQVWGSISLVVLICISLTITDIKLHFRYLVAICRSSLKKLHLSLNKILHLSLNKIVFLLSYRSSLNLYPSRLTSRSCSHRDPSWGMQFQGSGREGKRAGETRGAGVSKHEFLRGKCWCNWQGVCTVPFLRWQKVLDLSAEKVTVTHSHSDCMVEIDSPRFSSLFLAISVHLSFASLVLGWNWSVTFA